MSAEKTKNSLKVLKNKKVLLGVTSLITCAALIGVCSFIPFIIDPTQWQTTEFLTDELLICAIVIFSMISMMFIAQASNAQDENSKLAKSRSAFFLSIKSIVDRNAFRQWVKKVLQPNDIVAIKERIMREANIEDFTVLKLEYSEIKALLETPQKYNGRFYKGLSKGQVKTLLWLKSDKLKVHFVEPEYYLTVSTLVSDRTISERSSAENLKKSTYLAKSIIFRLLWAVILAMIFASLIRDVAATTDMARAWQKFVTRLWAMLSSSFMGYLVGVQINDIDAEYIDMRTDVQSMFLQDKTFVALDQQEEAREEFIKRVIEEQTLQIDKK